MSLDLAGPAVTAPDTHAPRRAHSPRHLPLGWVVPAAALVAWSGAYHLGVIDPTLFSSPEQVVAALWSAATDGTLAGHLAVSVGRWLGGFALGLAAGLALGLLTGLSRWAERLLDPTMQMLRTVPVMGLVPLFVIWFGLGETPKVLLIAFGSFFMVYLETYSGIRGIDRKLVEVGRAYALGTGAMIRRIILPAALPQILQGVRLGLGTAWLVLVIAELTGANSGVGYWMQLGREFVRVDIVLAALIVFAAVGKIVDSLVRHLERRLLGWRDSIEKGV